MTENNQIEIEECFFKKLEQEASLKKGKPEFKMTLTAVFEFNETHGTGILGDRYYNLKDASPDSSGFNLDEKVLVAFDDAGDDIIPAIIKTISLKRSDVVDNPICDMKLLMHRNEKTVTTANIILGDMGHMFLERKQQEFDLDGGSEDEVAS